MLPIFSYACNGLHELASAAAAAVAAARRINLSHYVYVKGRGSEGLMAPGAANDGVKRHCLSVAFDDMKMPNTFDETNCHEKS